MNKRNLTDVASLLITRLDSVPRQENALAVPTEGCMQA